MSSTAPALPRPLRGRPDSPPRAARLRSLVRGREADPAWVRPALLGVLALAAALCLWNLTINGYSNTYYAAAAKAASESWKAWFFGALDPGSFITVDKPPLSLWLMGLSARVFGYLELQHPAPAGAVHDRRRRRPVRRGAPRLRPGRGPARRRRARADAGHRRDRPRQQPRRAARPAARRRRRTDPARDRVGSHEAPGVGRRDRRPGLHDEDAPGLDDRPRARRRVPARRPAAARPADRPARPRGRRDGRRERGVAGRGDAVAGLQALHRRQHRRLGLGPDPRLQRPRPPHRRRGRRRRRELRRRRRGCGGCSTSRSAGRSPGCCRSPPFRSSPACG